MAKAKKNSAVATASQKAFVTKFDGSEFGTDHKLLMVVPAGRDCIGIGVNNYKNRLTLDFRRFYRDEDDVWQSTQKGVGISPDHVKDLLTTLSANDKRIGKLLAEKAE